MRAYLAGPMRGIKDFNHPAFHAAADRLRALGYEVRNPAEHDTVHKAANPDAARAALRECMASDLAWIAAHADAVVVLPGWEDSRGAQAEVAVARSLDLPVHELTEVLDA